MTRRDLDVFCKLPLKAGTDGCGYFSCSFLPGRLSSVAVVVCSYFAKIVALITTTAFEVLLISRRRGYQGCTSIVGTRPMCRHALEIRRFSSKANLHGERFTRTC
jgi:hypothetical protein